ncbi:glycine zipper family protein [Paraburkholderia phymatum]|uniref:glycine zipper family protein n=1 Tax=Paraburkholderia phymatum TaxID=148447 RepID=UPI003F7529F2
MKQALPVTWMLAALLLADVASAQQPIFSSAKGQSQQKQANDISQCQSWATQNTGVNPAVLAQNPANQPPPQQSGQRLRGAAGGAATGAIAGDAGKGAAAGAIAGTVVGGSRQRRQVAAAQEQQQAAQQQTSQQMATWNRALAASMNGRGYTVQ